MLEVFRCSLFTLHLVQQAGGDVEKPTFPAGHDKRDLVLRDEREDRRELVSEEPCLRRIHHHVSRCSSFEDVFLER